MQHTGGSLHRKLHNGRCPISLELDNKVLERVELEKRRKSKGQLQDQEVLQIARGVGEELGITGFKASLSWLRRWKGRCKTTRVTGTGRTGVTGGGGGHDHRESPRSSEDDEVVAESNGRVLCCQLTQLSEEEKPGIVWLDDTVTDMGRNAGGVTSGCVNGGDTVASASSREGLFTDYSTPEHNYCMALVDTPISSKGSRSPGLNSNVAELLENVALLQAHEHTIMVGVENGSHTSSYDSCSMDESSGVSLMRDSNNTAQSNLNHSSYFLDYPSLGGAQDFPDSDSHSSLLEEEPFMSVFNHRSFTDPFPFLPPSYVCCPPENMRPFSTDAIGIDDLLQKAQELETASKRVRNKKSKTNKNVPSLNEATSPSCGIFPGGSSLSATHSSLHGLDHKTISSPSRNGLMQSPSYPGGLSSSPPGGLLANRISQPVFPDEPEIVFHELQLGSLHTTPLQ